MKKKKDSQLRKSGKKIQLKTVKITDMGATVAPTYANYWGCDGSCGLMGLFECVSEDYAQAFYK